MMAAINIIFDGPPGPEAGRFVEVELDNGQSINAGEWRERPDGMWVLRITELPPDLMTVPAPRMDDDIKGFGEQEEG